MEKLNIASFHATHTTDALLTIELLQTSLPHCHVAGPYSINMFLYNPRCSWASHDWDELQYIFKPELLLIWLKHLDRNKSNRWIKQLYNKLRQRLPHAYMLWITWEYVEFLKDFPFLKRSPKQQTFDLCYDHQQSRWEDLIAKIQLICREEIILEKEVK